MIAVAALLFSFQIQINQQIVVTASSLPETIESTPASVTVITKKEIDERAARDVADLLREVPGLTVNRTGSLGKSTSVFVRGASSKQVLVLWNGVEINDPYFSGYNWGQFSTAGVQRIEVVRGPFSSIYGADAVGGVINIITNENRDHADVDLAAGGRGFINGLVSYGQKSGATTFDIAAEHRQDNGFAPNDNDRESSLLGGFTFRPAQNATLGLTGRFANYDLGVPRNTNLLATAYISTPHHRENGTEWQLAVPVSAEFGGIHADLRLAQNHREDHNEDPDTETFGDTTSNRRTLHLAGNKTTIAGTIVTGLEVERAEAENHDSFGLDLATHHSNSNAFFVTDRFSRGPFELSAGVRLDHYDTFGSQTSPRIGVAWASNGNKLHASYGQAFRAPQIGELYLPFFGNPKLLPERSRSAEIGYDRYFATGANISITIFRNTFVDLIEYDLVANRFENIGLAHSNGVELSAAERRGPWTTALTYTYDRAIDESTDTQLVRRPKHSGSLAVGYERGAGSMQLVVARVGRRPDVTDLAPFGDVINPAYTVADFTVRWTMGSLTPYAKIENLTNTRYEEAFGFPSPTRRALVGVRYSLAR